MPKPAITPAVAECIRDYRMLLGLPPFDGPENITRNDGYFAASIERDYSEAIRKEANKVIAREKKAWKLMRESYLKLTKDI